MKKSKIGIPDADVDVAEVVFEVVSERVKSSKGCPVNSALLCKIFSRSLLSLSAPTKRNALITSFPPERNKKGRKRKKVSKKTGQSEG